MCRLSAFAAIALLTAGWACRNDTPTEPATAAPATARPPGSSEGFLGVDPLVFQCASVVPADYITKAVGGAVESTPAMFEPPTGTPAPCDFRMVDPPEVLVLDGAPAPAQMAWSVQFDCRDAYLASTEREMQRLLADEGAGRVDVGRWGLDHRGAATWFVDDDAPCTVKVVGPGAAQREAIARLVATNLTPANAPMRPRPAR